MKNYSETIVNWDKQNKRDLPPDEKIPIPTMFGYLKLHPNKLGLKL